MMNSNLKNYTLDENLRIFDNGSDEIRLRIGIWNYNEAVINLTGQSEDFKKCIRDILNKMLEGKSFETTSLKEYNILEEEQNNIVGLFDGLVAAKMLCSKEQRELSNKITSCLLGDYKACVMEDVTKEKYNNIDRILFISDSKYCIKTAKDMAKDMELNMDFISHELYKEISISDLTTNIDAFTTISQIEKLSLEFEKYCGIVICMHKPKISLLRNINRIALKTETPVVSTFIDGPFITAFSINPPKTGCIECFEQRALSRMEDHVSYQKFISSNIAKGDEENKGVVPILNMITNLALSEGYLLSKLKASKFEGRVLNIYVPCLEIQVEDLLRVPYCPACGNVSKAQLNEMNLSSRRIVDDIVSKIVD
ncbi:streptolysin associated protein SagC [Clostridium oceanicum]|uniref:Streptolysin associated protein SagC n=1 Tax=Clostridium oceanicum TaxID=1543 RepID=A0ABP3UI06_9CLOT